MGTPDRNPRRRFRVSRGFGRQPRFVLASSQSAARLMVIYLEAASQRVLARLSHAS